MMKLYPLFILVPKSSSCIQLFFCCLCSTLFQIRYLSDHFTSKPVGWVWTLQKQNKSHSLHKDSDHHIQLTKQISTHMKYSLNYWLSYPPGHFSLPPRGILPWFFISEIQRIVVTYFASFSVSGLYTTNPPILQFTSLTTYLQYRELYFNISCLHFFHLTNSGKSSSFITAFKSYFPFQS